MCAPTTPHRVVRRESQLNERVGQHAAFIDCATTLRLGQLHVGQPDGLDTRLWQAVLSGELAT